MSIAVVHDTSPPGRAALLLAAQEAALHSTELVVLHALAGTVAGVEQPRALEEDAVRRAVGTALPPGSPPWRVAVADPDPDAAGALLGLVESEGPERLVVGTRRRSPVGKLLMGQQVTRILLMASVPVLLVKPDDD